MIPVGVEDQEIIIIKNVGNIIIGNNIRDDVCVKINFVYGEYKKYDEKKDKYPKRDGGRCVTRHG